MSDKSEGKKLVVDDLDFGGISGGVEQKETPVEQPPQIETPSAPQLKGIGGHISQRNEYTLPIQTEKGWCLKNIRDVSGAEFLAWAEGVYPPLRTQRLDPDIYDGPSKSEHRKEVVNAIAKFYHDILLRRGYNANTLH